jgi:hypothetical protein
VETLAELNERLAMIDAAEDAPPRERQAGDCRGMLRRRADLLLPVSAEEFDYSVTLTPQPGPE